MFFAMCGRFALGIPKKRLEEVFGLAVPDDYAPSYNVAPGTGVLAVEGAGFTRRLWGLVPPWADDPGVGKRFINARSETVFDKPSFRESALHHRLLIPAQTFYEWRREAGGRTPFAFALDGQDCFAMAGIGASRTDSHTGEVLETMAVLTCPPNAVMAPVHDRMPVILPPEVWSAWLDPVASMESLSSLLVPYPAKAMRVWPVSSRVNSPVTDGPELLKPVPAGEHVGGPKQGSLL
ncbi:SOS response-associated peptidase [uncultured Pseudodesulfovibrio sp.]|uniref:SOS response-associated peptidase n=1 Tax=uncultured Pseudodesulfovibrio sp. TaxID=2035858 RepID=UPI0029C6DD6B|nr:SOS response-associated peptidase [uncultured Pseudodesulfovibrio sp.]